MITNFFKYIFVIVSITQFSFANSNKPIPIALNQFNTITLIFQSPIVNVVSPSSDFTFTYDENSNMGVIKATKTKQFSNLTVTTAVGNIYSFLLQPSDKVTTFVYILNESDAVGRLNNEPVVKNEVASKKMTTIVDETITNDLTQINNKPKNKISTIPETKKEVVKVEEQQDVETVLSVTEENLVNDNNDVSKEEGLKPATEEAFLDKPEIREEKFEKEHIGNLYSSDPETYYNVFCQNIPNGKPSIKKVYNKVGVIEFKLNNIFFDKNEMYLDLEIINSSAKTYTINDLKFYVKSRGATEPFTVKPLYVYNFEHTLEKNTSYKVVAVLKNTKLSTNQQLYLVLDGFDKDRFIMLQPPNELINR